MCFGCLERQTFTDVGIVNDYSINAANRTECTFGFLTTRWHMHLFFDEKIGFKLVLKLDLFSWDFFWGVVVEGVELTSSSPFG